MGSSAGTRDDEGTSLWLVGLNARVLDAVRRTALGDKLKDGRMFYTVSQAVEDYRWRTLGMVLTFFAIIAGGIVNLIGLAS